MSSSEGSEKTIHGCSLSFRDMSFLRSLSMASRIGSPPPPPLTAPAPSMSSISSSSPSDEKFRSSTSISFHGDARNSRPEGVTEMSP